MSKFLYVLLITCLSNVLTVAAAGKGEKLRSQTPPSPTETTEYTLPADYKQSGRRLAEEEVPPPPSLSRKSSGSQTPPPPAEEAILPPSSDDEEIARSTPLTRESS